MRLRWGLVAFFLALYIVHFVAGDHGLLRRMELGKELDQVAAENVRLRLEKERLIQEVQLHENDPMSLERLAREKYWMIGPEERIYRFPEEEIVPDVPLTGGAVPPVSPGAAAADEEEAGGSERP
jgi:cell division protein FtsB